MAVQLDEAHLASLVTFVLDAIAPHRERLIRQLPAEAPLGSSAAHLPDPRLLVRKLFALSGMRNPNPCAAFLPAATASLVSLLSFGCGPDAAVPPPCNVAPLNSSAVPPHTVSRASVLAMICSRTYSFPGCRRC